MISILTVNINILDVILDNGKIRLASSVKSQKGAIWTERAVNVDWWKIDVAFHVSGKGRLGADGLVKNFYS